MKFLLTSAVVAIGILSASAAMAEMRLKPRIVVTGSHITLGDLFEGAGAAAAANLGPAPEPGQKIALRLPSVVAFVQAQGLEWTPGPAVGVILVERASQTIGTADVLPLIDRALRKSGVDGLFTTELRQRDLAIELPVGKSYDLAITSMNFDNASSRFDATLAVTTASQGTRNIPLGGTVSRRVEIPVLARTVGRGETIGKNDIRWIEIGREEARRDIVGDADLVIGQQARRTLQGDRPLRPADLQKPLVVQKNDLVTMTVASTHMTLVMTGVAQEDGALGDTVRLLNPKSKKTVQGTVTGLKEVRIPSGSPLQLARN